VQLPKIAEAVMQRSYEAEDVALSQLVTHLRSLVAHFRSDARHVLIIDGLDEALSRDEAQNETLAALLLAAARLNADFRRWSAPVKIVVLCRVDLFDRLPGANKNKLRRDWAVVLDWYHDPRDYQASALVQLANLRATFALKRETDVLGEFFPARIREGDTAKLLLDHTRHTPRDFVQVLASIQRMIPRGRAGRVTRDQIMSGLRDYSISYFLPEIRDELDGYLSGREIEEIVSVLAATRKREFTYRDLEEGSAAVGAEGLDLARAVRTLFDCSALGTVQTHTSRHSPRGTTYFTFKYRNRNSTVSISERFILHRGVWKALNLL
jgi:hypothetical protein